METHEVPTTSCESPHMICDYCGQPRERNVRNRKSVVTLPILKNGKLSRELFLAKRMRKIPMHSIFLFSRGKDGWNCEVRQSNLPNKQTIVLDSYAHHLREKWRIKAISLAFRFQECYSSACPKIEVQNLVT